MKTEFKVEGFKFKVESVAGLTSATIPPRVLEWIVAPIRAIKTFEKGNPVESLLADLIVWAPSNPKLESQPFHHFVVACIGQMSVCLTIVFNRLDDSISVSSLCR